MSIRTVAAHAWHYGRWVLLGIAIFFVVLIVARIPAVQEKERTADTVAFMRALMRC
ncbi:MAG: hypothetical protein NUV59_02400 [Patescibacteria group bacterium]|nr:hypothetical protein [Patescibacteria group bacterium]